MNLEAVRLSSFRNLRDGEIRFPAGLNVFFGQNGQGKTNLLEAVYVLATTKSFRTRRLGDCVRQGMDAFAVAGQARRGPQQRQVALRWDGTKRLEINGKAAAPLEYLSSLDALVVSFEQLPVVRGAPEERRRFLDQGTVLLRKSHLPVLAEFRRVLRQRNSLLAAIRAGRAQRVALEAWEPLYAERAAAVTRARAAYVQSLDAQLARTPVVREPLQLQYVAAAPADPDGVRDRMRGALHREIALGRTLVGPHRDELRILLAGRDIQRFGSGGQQRGAVFALILAACSLYFVDNKHLPILIVDDLDAELDIERLEMILGCFQAGQQVLVSTSKPSIFESITYGTKWKVDAGAVSGS